MRVAHAAFQRAEPAVSLTPAPGRFPKRAELPVNVLPVIATVGRRERCALFSRQAAPHPRVRLFADQVRRPRPQPFENAEHRVRIAQGRQCTIHRTKGFPAASEMTARVGIDDLDDGARFLEALACFVDRVIAGAARAAQLIARILQLLRSEPAQSAPDRFVGLQSEGQRCLIGSLAT